MLIARRCSRFANFVSLQSHAGWCLLDWKIHKADIQSTRFLQEGADSLAHVIVETFVSDLVDLVYRSGRSHLASMASHSQREKNAVALAEIALNGFRSSPVPFSSSAPLSGLMEIGICKLDNSLSTHVNMSWNKLGKTLAGFITKEKLRASHPFFVAKGRLHDVCAMIRPTVSYHLDVNSVDMRPSLASSLARKLQEARVWLLPWYPQPNHKITTLQWIRLDDPTAPADDHVNADGDHPMPGPSHVRGTVVAMTRQMQQLQDADPTSEWTIRNHMRIDESVLFVGHIRTPSNFNIFNAAASKQSFQSDLADHFDIRYPPHRVGLLAGLALAPLLPYIALSFEAGIKKKFANSKAAEDFMRGDEVFFKKVTNTAGTSEALPWVEVFTLGWVFWLDVRNGVCSPGTQKNTPENILRKKLGMSFVCPPSCPIFLTLSFPDKKSIQPALYLRLGLASIVGNSVLKAWPYSQGGKAGWVVKSDAELTRLEKAIVAKWKLGGDHVVSFLLGKAGLEAYSTAIAGDDDS